MNIKIIFLVIVAAVLSQARVLNLSEEKFGSFFSLESGTSLIKTSPFDKHLASVDSYSDENKVGLGGEFGFIYSSPYIAWRFSFEILKPAKLKEVQALAGTEVQYLVDSELTAVAPKIGVELHLNRKPNYRLYLFGFYGSSNLTINQTYTQVVSPNADHVVEAKGASTESGGGLGFEVGFVDTTSFIVELGYRSLVFNQISYSKAVTSFQGASAAGDLLKTADNENRSVSFTGFMASVGFRFWM